MPVSGKQTHFLVILILGFYPLTGMGIDLIAPSLPAISQNLHVSATFSKNLIAVYLLGLAIGNFFIGFLSESWGRRNLLLLGLLLFVIASLISPLFPNKTTLLVGRWLQGLGISAFIVLIRAIFSDLLSEDKLAHTTVFIAMTWGIGTILGPVIGGYLQHYFGWQSCFYFLAAFGFIALTSLFFLLPETHLNRQKLNMKQIQSNLISLLSHRVFIGSVILMGFSYSLLIVFNTIAPFLIQVELKHSSIYFGHVALFMGLVFLIGTIFCRQFIKKYAIEKILSRAIFFSLIIAMGSLAASYFSDKNIWLIIVPSLLMFFGTGFIYPAGTTKGILLFRHISGSASALMNLINMLITAIVGAVMGFVSATTDLPLLGMYLLLILLCGLVYLIFVRPKRPSLN